MESSNGKVSYHFLATKTLKLQFKINNKTKKSAAEDDQAGGPLHGSSSNQGCDRCSGFAKDWIVTSSCERGEKLGGRRILR